MKYLNDKEISLPEVLVKLCDSAILSVLWLVSCLPVITILPASAALYYAVVKNLRRDRGTVLKVYWNAFKDNLKAGMALNVLVLFYWVGTWSWITFAMKNQIAGIIRTSYWIVPISLLFFGLFVQVNLFVIMSRYKKSLGDMILSSIYLAYRFIGSSFLAVVLLVGIALLAYVMPAGLIIWPVLYMYLLSLLVEKNLKKYMKDSADKTLDQWYLE